MQQTTCGEESRPNIVGIAQPACLFYVRQFFQVLSNASICMFRICAAKRRLSHAIDNGYLHTSVQRDTRPTDTLTTMESIVLSVLVAIENPSDDLCVRVWIIVKMPSTSLCGLMLITL